MKIYVSEKENAFELLKKLTPLKSGYKAVITPLDNTEASVFVDEFNSLEQHVAEIRKQFEDEIERLIQEIKYLECLVKLKEQAKQNETHKEALFESEFDDIEIIGNKFSEVESED